MATKVRPVVSSKNKYWISKHRYYELKHFCLQYPEWKKSYIAMEGIINKPHELVGIKSGEISDVTAKCAIAKTFYSDRMEMVEDAAKQADPELADYILKAVTQGLSFVTLKARLDIPCCKDTYYDRYRRFFWILSNARN